MVSVHPRALKLASLFALVVASWLMLCGFRPFTPVTTVCPTCAEKGDKITLTDGRVIVADVLAKNQDGYILAKYGELRFVQFPEISKVEYGGRSEPKVRSGGGGAGEIGEILSLLEARCLSSGRFRRRVRLRVRLGRSSRPRRVKRRGGLRSGRPKPKV